MTLGKRISHHRKCLGMTQEQLAEKLGITAQAVSKWENDQSCPDIALLPQLAEIFQITTDELLGRQAPPVQEAEVVEEDTAGDRKRVRVGKDDVNIVFDGGKWSGLAFAILILWIGLWMLATRLLCWDVSFWELSWPSVILWVGIRGLCKRFDGFHFGCTLAGAYFFLDQLPVVQFELDSGYVWPVVVVLLGIALLIDVFRKRKKKKIRIVKNGKQSAERGKPQIHFSNDGKRFECASSFGDFERKVHLPILYGGEMNCAFGDLTVDLSECRDVAEGCKLEANCSFGDLILLVPAKYRIEPESNTVFADFEMEGCPEPDAKVILMEANVSFGDVIVRYLN